MGLGECQWFRVRSFNGILLNCRHTRVMLWWVCGLCCALRVYAYGTVGDNVNVVASPMIAAGSSLAERVLRNSAFAYIFVDPTTSMQYNSPGEGIVGSAAGMRAILGNCTPPSATCPPDVDWIASEIPMTFAQVAASPDLFIFPSFSAAIVNPYNIPEIGDATLILTFRTLPRIFALNITYWDDQSILDDNPHVRYISALSVCVCVCVCVCVWGRVCVLCVGEYGVT